MGSSSLGYTIGSTIWEPLQAGMVIIKFYVRISNDLPFPPSSFAAPSGHVFTTTTIEVTTPARKNMSPSTISTMLAVRHCLSREAAIDGENLNPLMFSQSELFTYFYGRYLSTPCQVSTTCSLRWRITWNTVSTRSRVGCNTANEKISVSCTYTVAAATHHVVSNGSWVVTR